MDDTFSGTPPQELSSINPAIAAFIRNKMRNIFMIFPCSVESTGADLETITIRTRILRKHLTLERFGDEPIRRPPALVVAGDRDDHDLVGGKALLQLQELFAHLARIAEHQPRALLLDVGALLQRVAVASGFLERRHRRVDALRHVQAPEIDARGKALGFGASLRADHEGAHERPGLRLARGGLVPIAVGARHRLASVRADEMRESETQAELRGERAPVV